MSGQASVAASRLPSANSPGVVLCVPTYRRPEGLRKLLCHVAHSTYAGEVRLIVVDNDADNHHGYDTVREIAPSFPLPLECVIEPVRGQTYAYNQAFRLACDPAHGHEYVAVLDDDEYPDPTWLRELVAAVRECDADIVGGPVIPVFADPDHWLARTGLYEPAQRPDGRIGMIHGAGNMLIRRDVLAQYLPDPFANEYAFTGGSDLDFFMRCRHDGRRFAWASKAYIHEDLPAARLTLSWLIRRGFRVGTDLTRAERKYAPGLDQALVRWGKGAGLAAFGALSLATGLLWPRRFVRSLVTIARGTGRLAAEFNWLYQEYR
jgi:glycosyltransferase involved in cell wall biosynthesis